MLDTDSEMIVWWGTEVECASAVARLERERIASREATASALERLRDVNSAWQEIEPSEQVRRAASRLVRVHPLRAGDSLQLAAALVACEGDAASLQLVSLDARLVEAAEREGFPTLPD